MGRKKEALRGLCTVCAAVRLSALLSGHCVLSGCQAASCQAVTLGPDSDGSPRLSGSAVRLSDMCCQTVRESAVSAVRLSGTVRRCPGFALCCQSVRPGLRALSSLVSPLESASEHIPHFVGRILDTRRRRSRKPRALGPKAQKGRPPAPRHLSHISIPRASAHRGPRIVVLGDRRCGLAAAAGGRLLRPECVKDALGCRPRLRPGR